MQSNDINANTVSAVLTPPGLLQIDAKADVMLDPAIYREVCRKLAFQTRVDLFASWEHHQVPRYYAASEDAHAVAIDAFKADWRRKKLPYANPHVA